MRKSVKSFMAAVIAAMLVFSGCIMPVADVNAATGVSDRQKEDIFNLISKQSFSQIVTQTAYDYTDYFFYRSLWKVGNRFPYGNNGNYKYTISDGQYSYNVSGAKGCYAYAKFVQMAYYQGATTSRRKYSDNRGVTADGLKNLLQTQGQAGEHLRVDNTHSLVYLASNNDGFYAMSYEGGPIKLGYYTWGSFARKYRGKRVWLYNMDTAVNDPSASQNPPSTGQNDTWMELTGMNTPKTLRTGQSWTCTGTITSGKPIESVTGFILDVEGNSVYLDTVNPHTTTYRMANSEIDHNLFFNKLRPGIYFYHVTATNGSMTVSKTSAEINVGSVSKPVISGAWAPDSLRVGKSWTCSGKIQSDARLRRVTGEILDCNGKPVYSYTEHTTAYSYTIARSTLDHNLYFNRLGAGTYYYRITAVSDAGTSQWTSNPIIVR